MWLIPRPSWWVKSDESNRQRMAEMTVTALLKEMARPRGSSDRAKAPHREKKRRPITFDPRQLISLREIITSLDVLNEPCRTIQQFSEVVVPLLDDLQPVLAASRDVVKANRQSIEKGVGTIDAVIRNLTALKSRLHQTLQQIENE